MKIGDPNYILTKNENSINESLDLTAPLITVSSGRCLEPWITVDIRILQQKCDSLYRKYKRLKTRRSLKSFIDFKLILHQTIYNAKTCFYKNRLGNSISTPQILSRDYHRFSSHFVQT